MKKRTSLHSQKKIEGGIGPVIGIFLIVMALIAGAIYYWGQHLNFVEEQQQVRDSERSLLSATTTAGTMATSSSLGTSTKISDIEKDLRNLK